MNYTNEKLIANLVFGTSIKTKLENMTFDENFIKDLKIYVEMMSNNQYLNKRMQNNIYMLIEKLRETNKANWDDLNDIISLNNRATDRNILLYYFSEYIKRKNIEYDQISIHFEYQDFLEQDLTSLYNSIVKDYDYLTLLQNASLEDENFTNTVLPVLMKDETFKYCLNGFKNDKVESIKDKLDYIKELENPSILKSIKKIFKKRK
ncbi:MAG: hypothetical protein II309_08990 [Bacilli bacterium]|nr:hypothetical protein [Bacilli bacterium]